MKLKIRAEELRRRRLMAGLSQEELATKTDGIVSSSAISKLEVLGGGIWPKTARSLAAALNCGIEDIAEFVLDDAEEVTA